ncbi:hypothetical protein Tco_1338570 [Tanacetum coccineum]
MIDYSLWEVIKNGNKVLKRTVRETKQEYEPTTAEEKQDKRNKMKARGTLTNSNNSTNEADNTAYGVSDAHTQSNPTSGDNLSDAVICAFLASHPNSPQLAQEDLEQIDPDDLEEMDLQWEMAMLTIRARRFIKRTCRKLDVNGQRVGFDNYQAEEEHPTNFALMAHTSSGSSSSLVSEVDSCSKSCVQAYATLKEQYDTLSSDYKRSQFNLVSYKAGLESVEARLATIRKIEDKQIEKQKKKRNMLKLTLEKFQNSFKSLNNLLESQVSVKFKTGLGYNAASSTAASPVVERFVNSSEMLENQENNKSKFDKGYHAVPPPLQGLLPIKLSNTVESNHESAGVKSNGDVVEPKTIRKNSFRPPVIEDWNSDDESKVEIIPKDNTVSSSTEKIKLVKPARETVEKIETSK